MTLRDKVITSHNTTNVPIQWRVVVGQQICEEKKKLDF